MLREEEHLAGAFCLGVLKRILCAVASRQGRAPFGKRECTELAAQSTRLGLGWGPRPPGPGLGPAAAGRRMSGTVNWSHVRNLW